MSSVRIDWTIPIEHNGLTLSLDGWADRLGLNPGSLKNRIRTRGKEWALSNQRISAAAAGRRGGRSWKRRYSMASEAPRA